MQFAAIATTFFPLYQHKNQTNPEHDCNAIIVIRLLQKSSYQLLQSSRCFLPPSSRLTIAIPRLIRGMWPTLPHQYQMDDVLTLTSSLSCSCCLLLLAGRTDIRMRWPRDGHLSVRTDNGQQYRTEPAIVLCLFCIVLVVSEEVSVLVFCSRGK